MRLFRSEEDVPEGGARVSIEQLRELAARWYGDRLDPDWRPRSREQSQAILDSAGLREPFWRLP
jgi:hypothetical protein